MNEDEKYWNPEEQHNKEYSKNITLLTGKPGDIIEARDGIKYRVHKDGSFRKIQ